jgi:Phosphotransferase enzyme family
MRGSLGEKIGEGAYADVHAWAPGQVVKLFKAGVPRRLSWWEGRMTRAVFAAGGPALEVFDEVTLEGRFGMVLSRLDGPTLLQLTRSGAMTFGQAGAILASVCLSVHETPPPPDVISLRDSMDGSLLFSGGIVPKHIATGILALIERLRPGDGLCHGDLHPDNVIMTADGPRLIDWIGAVRAPAAFDLAISHILLTERRATSRRLRPNPGCRARTSAVASENSALCHSGIATPTRTSTAAVPRRVNQCGLVRASGCFTQASRDRVVSQRVPLWPVDVGRGTPMQTKMLRIPSNMEAIDT